VAGREADVTRVPLRADNAWTRRVEAETRAWEQAKRIEREYLPYVPPREPWWREVDWRWVGWWCAGIVWTLWALMLWFWLMLLLARHGGAA
jgi:hypothetical protein